MTPETVLSVAQNAMVMIVLISAPLLLSALVVGLLVGMIQAATQINEMTLSFIPKLLVLFGVLYMAGPWLLNTMVSYTRGLIQEIPFLIG